SALLTAYPQFAGIQTHSSEGFANYHALQVEFGRQFSNGLTFQTNYTFAKTMQALGLLNPGDPRPEKVIAASDRPHIWRFLGIYELPFGPGRAFRGGPIVNRIIGGWQTQAVIYGQSGTPIDWGNVLFRGNIKDIPVDDPTDARMFNVDAGFEKAPARQLASNLRTFPTRLAGVRVSPNWDTALSLIKNTTIRENLRFQARLEAFNALNQHFFTAAPTTAPTSTAFGVTTAATGARAVQVALKLIF
ncbi:MAG: hypothetical protein ABIZ80_15545, partial [Bryobacteraceae bacterium]